MNEYINKHLDKRYPTYQHIIDMDSDARVWVRCMFGLTHRDSVNLYNDWCQDRFDSKYTFYSGPATLKNWFKDGRRHRDNDLPAVIDLGNYRMWFKDGKRHRGDDKPAIEYENGRKVWFKNDNRHRDGGKPAVEYPDGTKEWYKNGEQYYPNK